MSRRDWVALLVGALLVRVVVAFGILHVMPLQGDALFYHGAALDLVAEAPLDEPFFWPPGQPAFLALAYYVFGPEVWVARLSAIALGVAQVVLVTLIARELLSDTRAVRAAGWVAALYSPAVMMSGQTYSQHLAGVALTLLAWCLIRLAKDGRTQYALLGGVALGIGCLTRPSALVLIPLIVLLAAWHVLRDPAKRIERKRRVVPQLVIAFGVAAVLITPAVLHNDSVGAGLSISTNTEMNLFYGNNPYTPHYKTSHFGQRPLHRLQPEARAYLRQFVKEDGGYDRDSVMSETLRFVITHPFITTWRTLNRLRAFWGFDYLMARAIQNEYGLGTGWLIALVAMEASGYCAVMLLTLLVLLEGRTYLSVEVASICILVTLFYQAPYALAFSSAAYHYPVMGLVIPFAGLALGSRSRSLEMLRLALRSIRFRIAFVLFLLIQLEYAYHTIVWM